MYVPPLHIMLLPLQNVLYHYFGVVIELHIIPYKCHVAHSQDDAQNFLEGLSFHLVFGIGLALL